MPQKSPKETGEKTDKILFVTSFGPDLYDATGKAMLESYFKLFDGSEDRLLICYEDNAARRMGNELHDAFPRAELYNLTQDQFLRKWLTDNKEVIPKYLGGLANECHCPQRHKRHGTHRRGCHYSWMNRNASRWFRKVASWHYAANQPGVKWLVWVDCDSVFHKVMRKNDLREIMQKDAMVYCRGKREAIESGVLGFNLPAGGMQFIEAVCRRYTSKEYRRWHRWDDGFIVTTVVNNRKVACRDLVDKNKQEGNNVVPLTAWAEYLTHLKGSHGTRLGIMK